MTEAELDAATVAWGVWLYDGAVDAPVRIVGLPFDYGFAIAEADDQLEPGETPRALGPEGLLYYVSFAQVSGPGWTSIAEAKTAAQALAPSPIRWSD